MSTENFANRLSYVLHDHFGFSKRSNIKQLFELINNECSDKVVLPKQDLDTLVDLCSKLLKENESYKERNKNLVRMCEERDARLNSLSAQLSAMKYQMNSVSGNKSEPSIATEKYWKEKYW